MAAAFQIFARLQTEAVTLENAGKMINRSEVHFCLKPRVLLTATAISSGLFLALLVFAFLCWAAGWISFAICWGAILLIGLLGLVGFLGGIFAVFGGFAMLNDKEDAGCGVVIAGAGAWFVGSVLLGLFQMWCAPVSQSAQTSLVKCHEFASYIFFAIFVGYRVYLWSWVVLAVALAASAVVLVTIGLLRTESFFKYSLFKIGYACPRCPCRIPLFRCTNCNELHGDLKPSIYGVITARCAKCNHKLATMDLFGRLDLDMVCCKCSYDIDGVGRRGEYHFAVVGASSSGKTNLMITSLWRFETAYAHPNGIRIVFDDVAEEREYRQNIARLNKGQTMPKTVSTAHPKGFNLPIRLPSGRESLLYFYDAAGEDFEEGNAALTGHGFTKDVDAIVLLVDPFAEHNLKTTCRPIQSGVNPASADVTEILGRLIPFWERMLRVSSVGQFTVPIAVVVTKADAMDLPVELRKCSDLSGQYESAEFAAQEAVRASAQIRRFINQDLGVGNVVQLLESRFSQVEYFVVSTLGRSPDPGNRTPFQPKGVLAPLIWLGYQTGAISDATTLSHSFWNAGRYLQRSLNGFEGTPAQVSVWLALLGGISGLLYLLWWLGGLLLCTTFTVAAILAPLVWLRYRAQQFQDLQWLRDRLIEAWDSLEARLPTEDDSQFWTWLTMASLVSAVVVMISVFCLIVYLISTGAFF